MKSFTGEALAGIGIDAMYLNPNMRRKNRYRLLSSLQLIAHCRSDVKIVERQECIRLDIIRDLIKLDLLTCRPISHKRITAELAAQTTRRVALVRAETVTMATEHAQK